MTKASLTSTQPQPASMDMDGTRKGGNRIPTVYLLEPSISSTSPSYLEPHKTPTVPDTHIPVITVPIPPLPMMQQRQSRAFSCWVSYTYMRMGPSKRPAGRLLTRVEEQSRTRIGDPRRRGRASVRTSCAHAGCVSLQWGWGIRRRSERRAKVTR